MARQPAKTMLEAALRTRIAEDQLTELVAHLLDQDGDVLAAFLRELRIPADLRKRSLVTQRVTPSVARRIDLEVRIGPPAHVIWVEVKDRSPEHGDQLAAYKAELEAEYPGRHSLVALVPEHHEIRQRSTVQTMTWQQLAGTCDQIGYVRGGRNWRSRARSPDAELRQRSILEFLDYLLQRRLAVSTQPITLLDAVVAPRVDELLRPDGIIPTVLDAAVAVMHDFSAGDDRWPSQRTFDSWHGRTLVPRTEDVTKALLRFKDSSLVPSLRFVPRDDWDREDDPRQAAAFAAGVWSELPGGDLVSFLESESLPMDMFVNSDPKDRGIRKLLYLGDVAAAATTAQEQGENVGRWAQEAIKDIAALLAATV